MVKIVQPPGRRSKVINNADGIEFRIPAHRLFTMIYLMAWLGLWATGEYFAVHQLLEGSISKGSYLFYVFWLVGWTIAGGYSSDVLVWSFFGVECVRLQPGVLSLKRNVFAFSRQRGYELEQMKEMRVDSREINPFDFGSGLLFWGVGSGNIAFDYGSSTVRFGTGLQESEAKQILKDMQGHLGR